MSNVIIALYIFATSAALVVLRLGSKDTPPVSIVDGKLAFHLNMTIAAGVVLFGTSFVLYTYLLSKYDLGYIVPITTAFVYTIVFTASYFVFQESFTLLKLSGILLVLGGVVLLNLSN